MTQPPEKTSTPGFVDRSHSVFWRLHAYLQERFPLTLYGILILSFYLATQCVATTLSRPGQLFRFEQQTWLGFLFAFLFFLHLRLFDDLKDYSEDCLQHPDRVLQRGVIKLAELKRLAAIAICIELFCGLLAGAAAATAAALAIAFSLLMGREFFARSWLRSRPVIYALSHMLVVPLLAFAIFSFGTQQYAWRASSGFCLFTAILFCMTFRSEISRKLGSTDDQQLLKEQVYSNLLGVRGVVWLLMLLSCLETILSLILAAHLSLGLPFYLFMLGLFSVSGWFLRQYALETLPASVRRLQHAQSGAMLAFYWSWIIALSWPNEPVSVAGWGL